MPGLSALAHVHLDDDSCMEVTALLGSRGDLQHFADRIFAERGDCFGRVAMIPASAKAQRPPKAYLTIETPTVACLSRVNRVVVTVRRSLPVRPQLRTFSAPVGTSQMCHFWTHANKDLLDRQRWWLSNRPQ
jgi:NikR C terminal nickel binding domain